MLTPQYFSDCRYYVESDPEDGHRLLVLDVMQVFGGAEVAFPRYWTEPEVMNSLEDSKYSLWCGRGYMLASIQQQSKHSYWTEPQILNSLEDSKYFRQWVLPWCW